MPLPIEDYALIGDRGTAALVGNDGSVDWLCLPRFDSPACFAALLGDEDNGRWLLAPADEYEVTRSYVGDTALLETTFTTADGHRHDPRRDAHQRRPRRPGAPGHGRARHGPDAARVGGPPRLREDPALGEPTSRRRRTARRPSSPSPGRTSWCCAGPRLPAGRRRPARRRVRRGRGRGADLRDDLGAVLGRRTRCRRPRRRHREHPRRGGGLEPRLPGRRPAPRPGRAQPADPAAAHPRRDRRHRRRADHLAARGLRRRAQLGLPLHLAPRRRRSPSRRSLDAGFTDEASLWRSWLLRAVAGDPEDLQIMYAVDGARRLPEHELDHLAGLRRLDPGPDRQRGRRPAPDRRARRGDDRLRAGPPGRDDRDPQQLVAAARARRRPRRPLGPARQRVVGDPGPAAALHPLAGDGVGGLRPRGPGRRGARPRRTRGPLAAGP